MEINPRHPLVKELLRRVDDDPADAKAKSIANMMFQTGKINIGFFQIILLCDFHILCPQFNPRT